MPPFTVFRGAFLSSYLTDNNRIVVGTFDVYNEGGSFISNPGFSVVLPNILSFFSKCVQFDKKVKFTKFDSPVYGIVPCMITKIANDSRRDSGFRLLSRCVRHSTDSKFYPGKLSFIKVVDCKVNSEKKTLFEWSCDVPASMKNERYMTKIVISSDGDVISCDCICKVGGIKDKTNVATGALTEQEKN